MHDYDGDNKHCLVSDFAIFSDDNIAQRTILKYEYMTILFPDRKILSYPLYYESGYVIDCKSGKYER